MSGSGELIPSTTSTDAYVTVVEADEFFANRLGTDVWDDASESDQTKALQMATTHIDSLDYQGYKYLSTQDRQFPRKYSIDPLYQSPWGKTLLIDSWGYAYESDVPQVIKDACCLEALALLEYYASTDPLNEQDLVDSGVKSFSLGKISMTLSRTASSSRGLRSDEAYRLLSRYLENGGFLI